MSVVGRRRRDRIGADHLLAFGSVGLDRKPLSRNKAEMSNSVHFEFEVLGKLESGMERSTRALKVLN